MATVCGLAGRVPIFKGQSRPLLREQQHDPEIHGVSNSKNAPVTFRIIYFLQYSCDNSLQESGLEGSDALDKFPIDPEFLLQQKMSGVEDSACADHACLRIGRIMQEVREFFRALQFVCEMKI